MPSELELLIDRLNPICRRGLELAAGRCVAETHHRVEVEHLLLELAKLPAIDLPPILDCYGVDAGELTAQLGQALASFERGNRKTPAMAPEVVRLLREGLTCSTLNLGAERIRSGALLLALVQDGALRRRILSSCPVLGHIPSESLAQNLRPLVRGSVEEAASGATPTAKGSRAAPAAADAAPTGRRRAAGSAPGGRSVTGPAEEATPTLERFTVDLVAEARAGRIDPIRERDVEIRQVVDVLTRRRQNNPLLVGDAGVGKTAIAEGLALKVAAREVPESLAEVSIRLLDLGRLQAGAGGKGEFEERLESIVDEARRSPRPVVLYIDEAHGLIGAGGAAGRGDAANLLKPALARGELRVIAATTWSEYKAYIETDPALARRFQLVKVEEPSEAAAIEMLSAQVPGLERHHGVRVLDEAVRDAVRLALRYLPETKLPAKAISLLDTACARASLARQGAPPVVDSRVVADVVSGWTGIPAGRMLGDEIDSVLGLGERLAERIVGQPEALQAIGRRLSTARSGLEDPGRPRGVFLLVGPPGVGKTETALALADLLYGGERNLISLDMSEFQEPHSVATLKGAPPGYVGYGRGGVLTEAVRRRPYSVVLLDDFDKAHPEVAELFVPIFGKGAIEDGEGVRVDFTNAVILLTSGVGGDEIARACREAGRRPDPERLAESLRGVLEARFRSALLGRLEVVPFYPLGRGHLRGIAQRKLRAVQERVRLNYGAELSFADGLLDALADRCAEGGRGARKIDDALDRVLLPELSRRILQRMAAGKGFSRVHVTADMAESFR
jgi:type VI secretion system protein VasG